MTKEMKILCACVVLLVSTSSLCGGDDNWTKNGSHYSYTKTAKIKAEEYENGGCKYTFSVSVPAGSFDTSDGATTGSPSGIALDVTTGNAKGTIHYTSDKLPTSDVPISMNGKLIIPGDSGGGQPTWGASATGAAPFYIKSNQDGGAKDIVVKAGTSVTYTAYEGTSSKSSNWTVNGQPKNNETSIIFSRSWWDVPGWFFASMGTPDPGIYIITAIPTDGSGSDSGTMTVVGVDKVQAKVKNASSYSDVSGTLYVAVGDALNVKAIVDPSGASWPSGTPEWSTSGDEWFSARVSGVGEEKTVDTSTVENGFTITATCGYSEKSITVAVVGLDYITVAWDSVTIESDTETPGDDETIYVKANEDVTLTAFTDPSGMTFPDGYPTWSGGGLSGTGEAKTLNKSPSENTITVTCGTDTKKIIVVPFTANLDVSKSSMTLKHDRESNLSIVTNPTSVAGKASSPKIEIKRSSKTTWYELEDSLELQPWRTNIAGTFKLRGNIKLNNKEHLSSEKNVTVNFPTYAQIIADSSVSSSMSTMWTATLNDCTQTPNNQRREKGFWISLNTSTNSYQIGSTINGPYVGPDDYATINLGKRPGSSLSSPNPNASGTIYAVSSFHTHPPFTYANISGISGPSDPDRAADYFDNVAGIVYDYVQRNIPAGYPKNSPAQTHESRTQRDITRE
ncbi:MAG: hypothetical protein PHS31_08945 [Victivallaceae bacterium]|nr:hypothetical protein [Victivallaceae bacterium]MDD4181813.1 hypothetical protein [Victivallaceae bacterium]